MKLMAPIFIRYAHKATATRATWGKVPQTWIPTPKSHLKEAEISRHPNSFDIRGLPVYSQEAPTSSHLDSSDTRKSAFVCRLTDTLYRQLQDQQALWDLLGFLDLQALAADL